MTDFKENPSFALSRKSLLICSLHGDFKILHSWKREVLEFLPSSVSFLTFVKTVWPSIRYTVTLPSIIYLKVILINMLTTGWLSGCCISACFMLVFYFTKMILDYLDSKPSGRRTLMDELNKVSLYSFLLIVLSNYPFTIVLIFGPDLSHSKYIAAFLSIIR